MLAPTQIDKDYLINLGDLLKVERAKGVVSIWRKNTDEILTGNIKDITFPPYNLMDILVAISGYKNSKKIVTTIKVRDIDRVRG